MYARAGFRLPNDLFGDQGTLMLYVVWRHWRYDALADPVQTVDAGVNWLIRKHMSKISLNYQLRPVFRNVGEAKPVHDGNASAAWVQFQVSL